MSNKGFNLCDAFSKSSLVQILAIHKHYFGRARITHDGAMGTFSVLVTIIVAGIVSEDIKHIWYWLFKFEKQGCPEHGHFFGISVRKPDFVACGKERHRQACVPKQSDRCRCYSLSGK